MAIIGEYFDGDDRGDVTVRQHDVYDIALKVMLDEWRRHVVFAELVLTGSSPTESNPLRRVDHRTLQSAHDLLAAAWRFKTFPRRISLPLGDRPDPQNLESAWLSWLRDEVARWTDDPWMVRWMSIVLDHQNQPMGYEAEDRLCLGIMHRFPKVPWRAGLERALRPADTGDTAPR